MWWVLFTIWSGSGDSFCYQKTTICQCVLKKIRKTFYSHHFMAWDCGRNWKCELSVNWKCELSLNQFCYKQLTPSEYICIVQHFSIKLSKSDPGSLTMTDKVIHGFYVPWQQVNWQDWSLSIFQVDIEYIEDFY